MNRGGRAMAHVADHLSIVELEERYRSCTDACSARHFQTIWLLAQGHTIEEAAETTGFVPRWIEELLARWRVRLNEPPPDGGLWTSGKVAHWMARELGLAKVRAQRGWEALKAIGWSLQSPRRNHPPAARSAQEGAF